MTHQVQVAASLPTGVQYVVLPNGLQYPAGTTVILSDEQFSKLQASIFTDGYLVDQGEIGVTGTSAGTQTAVQLGLSATKASALTSGAASLTAGTVSYAQPFIGSSYKKFALYLAGATLTGAITITFPTAFTVAPAITDITAGATTALTQTGNWTATTTVLTSPTAMTTQTGWVFVEGW